jgi:hypothetical protein
MPYLYPEASHAGPACRRPSCTGRGTVMGWASGWQAAGTGINWEAALYCDQCDCQIETPVWTLRAADWGLPDWGLPDWDDLPEETAI